MAPTLTWMRATYTAHHRHQEVLESIYQVDADLETSQRAEKYAKMAASPYRFFRGSNSLFWKDFFRDWHFALFGGVPESQTWIQGDAHVYNFGAFGTEKGSILYGMDDFDDSIIADYQYDLWRLSISLVLDCRDNGFFSEKKQRKALKSLGKAYLKEASRTGAGKRGTTPEDAKGPLAHFLDKVKKKKDRGELLGKWTIVERGERQFSQEHEKLEPLSDRERQQLADALGEHLHTLDFPDSNPGIHFKIKDAARRLQAGTGSLGLERYYAIIEGADEALQDDIILDIKEQSPPEACRQMNEREMSQYRAEFPNEGIRHARAFRAIAHRPDPYLGWLYWNGRHFSIRERSPFKEDFPTDKTKDFEEYRDMASTWGRVLAREHLRGADGVHSLRSAEFASHIKNIRKNKKAQFLDFLEALSFGYADCVSQDFQVFLKSLNYLVEGRLPE